MSESVTDLELLRRIAAGDRPALGALASRHEHALLGLALSLTGRRKDQALDAVQDCWIKVIRASAAFRGESSVKSWLFRIVINRCHDLRRSAERRAAGAGADACSLEPARGSTHEDRERMTALQAAVDSLTEERRALVLLCYVQGMSHEDAAAALGIPVGTLKSRLHATLTQLRGSMAETPLRAVP